MRKPLLMMMAAAAMCATAQNPVIQTVFTPDPAPFVHGDTVYLFVDHDEDDAQYFSMRDWMLFSTQDMVNWTYLGTPVSTETFEWAKQGDRAWAAQAVERDGKWYWYLCCNTADGQDALCVAVADKPTGPWRDAIGGPLATGWGFIDPTVFIDDDGRAYLFWGNKGFWYGELNDDMVSFKDGYREVPGYTDPASFGELQSKMDWSIGHNRMMTQYEEGPWVSKHGDTYYVVYPAGGVPEYMAYSTAPTVNGPWTFRGRIMDEAENSFTIHGGNIEIDGRNFMFYHNGLLPNGGGFRRSTAVEEFEFNPDGSIPFIPFTKEGVKTPLRNLNPYERVEGETMADSYGLKVDRNAGDDHYLMRVHNGDWLRLRSVDFGEGGECEFLATVANVVPGASIQLRADALGGKVLGELQLTPTDFLWSGQGTKVNVPEGVHDLYLLFRGPDSELLNLDYWLLR